MGGGKEGKRRTRQGKVSGVEVHSVDVSVRGNDNANTHTYNMPRPFLPL